MPLVESSATMNMMVKSYDFHREFHDVLGHITTIRSASSVLINDYKKKIPPEIMEMIRVIYDRSTELVEKIENLRNETYKLIDTKSS